MDLETLKLEWPSPGVALVTLNRPSRANAINMIMLQDLDAICKLIEGEGSVLKREFLEKVRTLGLRGALQWRNERADAGHS